MKKAEFDSYAKGYAPGMGTFIKRALGGKFDAFLEVKVCLLKLLLPPAFEKQGLRLLDFGCGTGEFLQQLVDIGFIGKLTGCDISGEMLSEAKKRWLPERHIPSFVLAEPNLLPVRDNAYEIVTSSCVFHHIPIEGRVQSIREIARVLKPGGVAVIFEHNPYNPLTRWMVMRSPFDKYANLLSATELIKTMAVAGFKPLRREYFMFFPPRIRSLNRIEWIFRRIPLGGQYIVIGKKLE